MLPPTGLGKSARKACSGQMKGDEFNFRHIDLVPMQVEVLSGRLDRHVSCSKESLG